MEKRYAFAELERLYGTDCAIALVQIMERAMDVKAWEVTELTGQERLEFACLRITHTATTTLKRPKAA